MANQGNFFHEDVFATLFSCVPAVFLLLNKFLQINLTALNISANQIHIDGS